MEDCERTLCGGVRGVRRFGVLLGLGWRDMIATIIFGNADPVNTNQSQKKDTTLYHLLLQKLQCWIFFSLSVVGKWQMSYATC